jgi:hypothetical protein
MASVLIGVDLKPDNSEALKYCSILCKRCYENLSTLKLIDQIFVDPNIPQPKHSSTRTFVDPVEQRAIRTNLFRPNLT